MVNIYAPPSGITWLQGAAWRLSPHEGSEPVVEALLDDPPEVLATPPVRYPPLLREAGIEGTVVLEFVVDTLGHAEPATIRIISSTQEQFEAPAREAILTSLYRPGRWRGQPVRALSLERVAFTIQR
jgi:protein TonB